MFGFLFLKDDRFLSDLECIYAFRAILQVLKMNIYIFKKIKRNRKTRSHMQSFLGDRTSFFELERKTTKEEMNMKRIAEKVSKRMKGTIR